MTVQPEEKPLLRREIRERERREAGPPRRPRPRDAPPLPRHRGGDMPVLTPVQTLRIGAPGLPAREPDLRTSARGRCRRASSVPASRREPARCTRSSSHEGRRPPTTASAPGVATTQPDEPARSTTPSGAPPSSSESDFRATPTRATRLGRLRRAGAAGRRRDPCIAGTVEPSSTPPSSRPWARRTSATRRRRRSRAASPPIEHLAMITEELDSKPKEEVDASFDEPIARGGLLHRER